jgi:outer membrane lipoprotein-sorting protein
MVTTTSIARDGDLRRSEEKSGNQEVVYLDLGGHNFTLLPQEKIYAEATAVPSSNQPEATADGPDENYVHTAPIESIYENLGTESINGQRCNKYRVVVKHAGDTTVSETETLIWIDEHLEMPVKSVTRSAAGTRTMELSAVTLSADKQLFEIPKDYKKVDAKALLERIR